MSDRARMEAFVSLATNDQYAYGALALGKSLRDSGTQRRLCLLIADQVTQEMRIRLQHYWDEILLVNEIISGDREHLELLRRPELEVTYSKLHIWRLLQFQKGVFLDADTLVLSNVDALFDYEELSAAPDVGWPDIFNSGVFVFKPSLVTFQKLVDLAKWKGSFDGGDQGLLNTYWSDWSSRGTSHRLPFSYNVVANYTYTYTPALRRFRQDIKIVHFLGPIKPWHHRYDSGQDRLILMSSDQSQLGSVEFLISWWRVYSSTLSQPAPTEHHAHHSPPPQYRPPPSHPYPLTQPDPDCRSYQPDPSTYPAPPDPGFQPAPPPDPSSQPAPPPDPSSQPAPPPDPSSQPAPPLDPSSQPAPPDPGPQPAPQDSGSQPPPDAGSHTTPLDSDSRSIPDTGHRSPLPDADTTAELAGLGTIDLMASGTSLPAPSEESQREAWERKEPDYLGIHQSDNIMAFLSQQMKDL